MVRNKVILELSLKCSDIMRLPIIFRSPLKIYDEILVNAADNKVRDPSQSLIKVNIDKENNEISIMNNGKGEKIVFELCFKTK